MSALNATETAELRKARATIQTLMRMGYNPATDEMMKSSLKDASDNIQEIVSKKGYHPS